ncbi:hypothetical protein MMC29_005317 [Sticta canariensis]|nr:hypothetical protein [Sticta canariensis]
MNGNQQHEHPHGVDDGAPPQFSATNTSANIIPLQINGKDVKTSTTYKVVNPTTNELAWESCSASNSEAIEAADAAQAAFPAWSKTKVSTRRDIFLKAADVMIRRADELSNYIKTETGADESFTAFNVFASAEQLRDVAGRIPTVVGHLPAYNSEDRSAMILKEPFGVVLGIAPWNAAYFLGFRAVTYAIAAGNTVILKGSELSPRCHWAVGSVFKEAGLPDGVLNVLTHRPQDAAEVTRTLVEHPAVKKINFTGSTAVGRIIAAMAGKNLKPVLLELGGKASAIVLKDADLELTATQCVIGAFLSSGQVCMATERIIVHSSLASPFSQALKKATAELYPQSGPASILITPVGVQKNKKLVSQALSQGASLVAGDINAEESSNTRMRPIIVEKVTPAMDLYYQESFGPTVSLFTFEAEEEAIKLANDTEYGLSAAVFTNDLAAGFRVAKQIESGAVHINKMTVHDDLSIPHGGVKNSGFGRFNASAGIEEFLHLKTITWADGVTDGSSAGLTKIG